jgi:hypothetical protein
MATKTKTRKISTVALRSPAVLSSLSFLLFSSVLCEGTKKIPCQGYRVTDRMAYDLAGLSLSPPPPFSLLTAPPSLPSVLSLPPPAIYRDNALPLTTYAREMLVEQAQHSQVGLIKPPVALADGAQLKARRKRLGMVDVCVHCIQVAPSSPPLSLSLSCLCLSVDLRRALSLQDCSSSGHPDCSSLPCPAL